MDIEQFRAVDIGPEHVERHEARAGVVVALEGPPAFDRDPGTKRHRRGRCPRVAGPGP